MSFLQSRADNTFVEVRRWDRTANRRSKAGGWGVEDDGYRAGEALTPLYNEQESL